MRSSAKCISGRHCNYSESCVARATSAAKLRPACVNLLSPHRTRNDMPKAKIFISHPLYPEARTLLQSTCECEFWEKQERPTPQEVLSKVKDKEGLVCLLTERVAEDVIRAAAKLRIVANVAVGLDNVDVPASSKRGVVVTNTPGVLDETTADFAWALMLAVARRVVEADQYVRAGSWQGWN